MRPRTTQPALLPAPSSPHPPRPAPPREPTDAGPPPPHVSATSPSMCALGGHAPPHVSAKAPSRARRTTAPDGAPGRDHGTSGSPGGTELPRCCLGEIVAGGRSADARRIAPRLGGLSPRCCPRRPRRGCARCRRSCSCRVLAAPLLGLGGLGDHPGLRGDELELHVGAVTAERGGLDVVEAELAPSRSASSSPRRSAWRRPGHHDGRVDGLADHHVLGRDRGRALAAAPDEVVTRGDRHRQRLPGTCQVQASVATVRRLIVIGTSAPPAADVMHRRRDDVGVRARPVGSARTGSGGRRLLVRRSFLPLPFLPFLPWSVRGRRWARPDSPRPSHRPGWPVPAGLVLAVGRATEQAGEHDHQDQRDADHARGVGSSRPGPAAAHEVVRSTAWRSG